MIAMYFTGVGSGVMFTFLMSYAFTRYMLAHPELWAPKVIHKVMQGTVITPRDAVVTYEIVDENLNPL